MIFTPTIELRSKNETNPKRGNHTSKHFSTLENLQRCRELENMGLRNGGILFRRRISKGKQGNIQAQKRPQNLVSNYV